MRTVIILITVIAVTLMASWAIAQSPTLLSYQGKLCDNSGNPVPDGNYQIIFMLYGDSIGGTPLWSEVHSAVHTNGGYFKADWGAIEPFDGHGILDNPTLYLQIQVGSMPPLTPRTRITSVPRSAIAKRISGDIQTDDSSLVMQNAQQSIRLRNGSENMGLVVEDRPADPVNGRGFHAGIDSGEVNLGFEGPNGQDLFSVSGKPGAIGKLSWGLFNPQPEPPGYVARLYGYSDPSGGGVQLLKPGPTPGDPAVEMTYGIGTQGSIRMFNPQPEPPGWGPLYSAQTDPTGVEVSLAAPQAGVLALINNHPQIKMRTDNASSKFLFQRAFNGIGGPADSIGIYMQADSVSSEMRFFKGNNVNLRITTNSNGTSSGYIDDGSEYMGIEPSPFHAGGDLIMKNAGTPTIDLSSIGAMGMFDDGSEYMGIEPSPWHAGGDLTMYSAAGGPTLVLASSGMISIGTSNHTNILTVQQYSPTDPIADAWTTYSSRRWKTNIQPLQGSLAKVMRLQGVSYDEKEGGKHNIGLIAEDVGQVVPEVVAYEDNGVDAKSVDYARLTALLIEAVKEQQKTIDQLKSELGGLKADLKSKQAISESGE